MISLLTQQLAAEPHVKALWKRLRTTKIHDDGAVI
jgi:hypothetical protein